MTIKKWRFATLIAALCLSTGLMAGLTGCGGGPNGEQALKSINRTNGERLANAYSFYQGLKGAGPPDVAAFKAFIEAEIPAGTKTTMEIPAGSIDSLFTSERDGQPFDIRPEAPRPNTGSVAQAVIFETQGVNGTLQVFYTGPKMVEVPAGEIEAYKSGDKDIQSGPPGLGN
jgi:hypothetical protein